MKQKIIKNVLNLRTIIIDIHQGENLAVLINEQDAREHGITSMDKISLIYDEKEFVFDVDLTAKLVQRGEIGLTKDVQEKYSIPLGKLVAVSFTKNTSEALDALKK